MNDFIGEGGISPEKVKIRGRVHTICKKANGELRYENISENDATDTVKNVLCFGMLDGTSPPCSNFLAAGTSSGADWNGKDGVFIYNSSALNSNGTVLAGGITAAATTNTLHVTASNELYNSGTMSKFVLGINFQTTAGSGGEYFTHEPGAFAYSSGDTITVNWTVSVT